MNRILKKKNVFRVDAETVWHAIFENRFVNKVINLNYAVFHLFVKSTRLGVPRIQRVNNTDVTNLRFKHNPTSSVLNG